MTNEYVNKKDLINALNRNPAGRMMITHYNLDGFIESFPGINIPEEKVGRWLWTDGVRCSCCNYKLETTGLSSYCPNCGARMEK